ncbi:MAG: hypothetical protein MJZ48_00120 [Paludibacteraceae bacterium]|nr:hypothetical protein [Paludibacteraceae bacterium]
MLKPIFKLKNLNCSALNYSLEGILKSACDDALQRGSADGLNFVKFIVENTDLNLQGAQERLKTSIMLYNQLTPEQLAEIRKEDE